MGASLAGAFIYLSACLSIGLLSSSRRTTRTPEYQGQQHWALLDSTGPLAGLESFFHRKLMLDGANRRAGSSSSWPLDGYWNGLLARSSVRFFSCAHSKTIQVTHHDQLVSQKHLTLECSGSELEPSARITRAGRSWDSHYHRAAPT